MKPLAQTALFLTVVGITITLGCAPEDAVSTKPTPMNTPAAQGSMAPNLSTTPDGTILLSWIEPDGDGNALKFSEFRSRGWSTPKTIARGENWFVNWADFPSVVALTDTTWAAHWLVSQESGGYAYDIQVALSDDSGASWSDPFIPHTDGTATEHGFVSIFNDENKLGMLWLDGRKMVNDYDENDVRASGMTLRTASFGFDQNLAYETLVDDLVCDCCQTDIAVSSVGPVAVYRNRTVGEIRDIYVSRRKDGEWSPGIAVNEDRWKIAACPVNGPVIAADGENVAVTWFTGANDKATVKAAWSIDAGHSFSAPINVDISKPLGRVGSSLLPNGDLAISWLQSVGDGGARLMIKQVSQTGHASTAYAVDLAGDVFAISVPQLARQDSELVLAWTAERNGGYTVESAIIPLAALPD